MNVCLGQKALRPPQTQGRMTLGAKTIARPQNWGLCSGTPRGSPGPRHLEGQTSWPSLGATCLPACVLGGLAGLA